MSDQGMNRDGGSRPVPDPTVLTTAQLREAISSLKELMEQEFKSVHDLSSERFTRLDRQAEQMERLRIEQKQDSSQANSAALSAIKDANEKTEASITQQLSQMSVTHRSDVEGLRRDIDAVKERIDDLRTRIVAVENQKVGAKEDRTGLYATLAAFGGIILLAVSVVAFLAQK